MRVVVMFVFGLLVSFIGCVLFTWCYNTIARGFNWPEFEWWFLWLTLFSWRLFSQFIMTFKISWKV